VFTSLAKKLEPLFDEFTGRSSADNMFDDDNYDDE